MFSRCIRLIVPTVMEIPDGGKTWSNIKVLGCPDVSCHFLCEASAHPHSHKGPQSLDWVVTISS